MKKWRKNLILVLNHNYSYEPVECNGEEESEAEVSSENTELTLSDGIAFTFIHSHFAITYLAVIARCCSSNHL